MVRFFLLLTALAMLGGVALESFKDNGSTQPQQVAASRLVSSGSFRMNRIDVTNAGTRNLEGYEEPRDQFETRSVNHWFSQRVYHAYVGRNANKTSLKPAVLLLHGSGRSGASMIDMWSSVADRHGLVLIAPDSAWTNSWSSWFDPLSLLVSMVDDASAQYGIDARRLYLFGHSAGGIYATELALNADAPFAAIATHAGFAPVAGLAPAGSESGNKPPILLFLGDGDHIFKIDDAVSVGGFFKEQGYQAELAVIRNHNHWYYNRGPLINEKAWRFFARH